MTRCLLDTGPLVAYVDAADPAHELVSRHFADFSGRLYTTAAVVTEAMHLVGRTDGGAEAVAGFLVASGTEVSAMTEPRDLQEAVELMARYEDTPMDFADATLVLLGQRLGIAAIATLDRRGFSAYRQPNGRGFRLILPPVS
jgi:predicted nucleic acid-binding protein